MLYISNSLKDRNRKINCDLRHVSEWFRKKEIFLDSSKLEKTKALPKTRTLG